MSGSFRLFRLFGIDVFLHWTWLIVAYFQMQRSGMFENQAFHVVLYLSLFGIVLMHEFGHALACKSVGGIARHIVLWPLGGIALVQPPVRPGAVLWSIVAGPLVNVALLPVLWGAVFAIAAVGQDLPRDVQTLVFYIAVINTGLLVFNMLPVYPLDGGQTLQALLWFVIGRAKSLWFTASMGLVVAAVAGVAALVIGDYWFVILALFVGWQSWIGFRAARWMLAAESADPGIRL